MADFDFASLGNLFGGGALGGTPSGLDALLSEDQRKLMGRNATLSAAAALLQASGRGPQRIGLGQALGSALQAGQQGYQQARAGSLQDLILGEKIKESQDARTRQASMSKLFPQVFQQTTTPAEYDESMSAITRPAQTSLTIDPNKLQALAMLSKNPLESLGQIAKLVPDLRRAGFTGAGASEVNPFSVFTSDQTIPANIRNVASRYAASFDAGTLDPDKVDDRTKQLADMAQRAQQFTESKEEREANRLRMESQFNQSQAALEQFRSQGLQNSKEARALAANIADQSLELRRQAEANKPEQFSYAQKKDFDTVQKINDAARAAEDSASIAERAAPLISQAFSGKIESGVKGFAGALGFSTDAKRANDQLTQLSQQLALKTPKFSGPTSDADAKRYDKAVGDLANPSVNQEAKLTALKDLQTIAKKQTDYAKQLENFYQANNKSLRGFVYTESNPFGK
jgi:vacuolar-type H+-ATPase subunit I/STV1